VVHGTGVYSARMVLKGLALERFPNIKKKKNNNNNKKEGSELEAKILDLMA
jgi:hypothetical protein